MLIVILDPRIPGRSILSAKDPLVLGRARHIRFLSIEGVFLCICITQIALAIIEAVPINMVNLYSGGCIKHGTVHMYRSWLSAPLSALPYCISTTLRIQLPAVSN